MSDIRLIFDIGMHRGEDSAFYLSKGFDVVAVEPLPAYVEIVRANLKWACETGQLVLIEKAVTAPDLKEITLFVNQQKDDSHTIRADVAQQNEASASFSYDRIQVGTITLAQLFDSHGVPYYLKCDIEGGDEEVLNQLIRDTRRPAFVSFEASDLEVPLRIRAAGYSLFQVRNQWRNPITQPPQPAREGRNAAVQFTGHASGLFGRELPLSNWLTFEQAVSLYQAWLTVIRIDPEFAPGWCDFHGTTLSKAELAQSNTFD